MSTKFAKPHQNVRLCSEGNRKRWFAVRLVATGLGSSLVCGNDLIKNPDAICVTGACRQGGNVLPRVLPPRIGVHLRARKVDRSVQGKSLSSIPALADPDELMASIFLVYVCKHEVWRAAWVLSASADEHANELS